MEQKEAIIELTESAREALFNNGVTKDNFLRITLVPGGCSGLTYQMDIDNVKTPFDVELYEDHRIMVLTDKYSLDNLQGLHIDYSSDLIKSGFKFSNPNAVSSCGCGNSVKV